MWVGDTIFYNSDRDGHFNLYAYNVGSGRSTQVTTNRQYDVRWPSSDNESQIVYDVERRVAGVRHAQPEEHADLDQRS